MLNDYIWTRLYAQREEELRTRARRRGGDAASAGSTRAGLAIRLLSLRPGRPAQGTQPTQPTQPARSAPAAAQAIPGGRAA